MFRNLLPTSLLGRTILIVLFPIVMFQLIILSYYYNSLWERTLNRLSRSVAMEIQMVARQYDEGQGSLIGPTRYTQAVESGAPRNLQAS